MMDSCNMYDWRMDEDESSSGDGSDSEYEREQLEIALYSQIHFEPNNESECLDHNNNDFENSFDFFTRGNIKSGYQANELTADTVLNRNMESKYGPLVYSTPSSGKMTKLRESSSLKKLLKPPKELVPKSENKMKSSNTLKSNKKKLSTKTATADKLILGVDSDGADSVITITDSDDESLMSESDENSDDNSIYGVLGHSDSDEDKLQMNVEGVQSNSQIVAESRTDDQWKINHQDSGVKAGKGRYYKPIECFNCSKTGHLSKNCTEPKKQPVCILCAKTGHISRACPEKLCFNCQEPGHESSQCPLPRCGPNKVCHRCQMTGHLQRKCPDMWRQFHLTVGSGRLREQTSLKKVTRPDTCYNCGEEGHLGHQCEDDRMNWFVCVNTPFICRYDNTSDLLDVGRKEYPEDRETRSDRKRRRSQSSDADDQTRSRNLRQLQEMRKPQGLPDAGSWREMGAIYSKKAKVGSSERSDKDGLRSQQAKSSGRNNNPEEKKYKRSASADKRTRYDGDVFDSKRNSQTSYSKSSVTSESKVKGGNSIYVGTNRDNEQDSRKLSPFIISKGNTTQLTGRNNFDNLIFTIKQDDARRKISGKKDKSKAGPEKTSRQDISEGVGRKEEECVIDVKVIKTQKTMKKKSRKKNKTKKTNQQVDKPVDSNAVSSQSKTPSAINWSDRYIEQDFPRGGNRRYSSGRGRDNINQTPGWQDRVDMNGKSSQLTSSHKGIDFSITVNMNRKKKTNPNLQTDSLFSLRSINKLRSGERNFNNTEGGDDDEDVFDVDHQAFQNEWWEKKKRRRRNKKKSNKTNALG